MLSSNTAEPFTGLLCSSCLLPSSDTIPCLLLFSCLPQPGGHSQPFLLSSSAPHLTIFLSVVALPHVSRQSAFLQSLPISAALLAALQDLTAPLTGALSQPTRLSLERQVEARPPQHFSGCQHVLGIVQRKPSGSFRTSAPGPAFAGRNGGLSELEGIDVQQSCAEQGRSSSDSQVWL